MKELLQFNDNVRGLGKIDLHLSGLVTLRCLTRNLPRIAHSRRNGIDGAQQGIEPDMACGFL